MFARQVSPSALGCLSWVPRSSGTSECPALPPGLCSPSVLHLLFPLPNKLHSTGCNSRVQFSPWASACCGQACLYESSSQLRVSSGSHKRARDSTSTCQALSHTIGTAACSRSAAARGVPSRGGSSRSGSARGVPSPGGWSVFPLLCRKVEEVLLHADLWLRWRCEASEWKHWVVHRLELTSDLSTHSNIASLGL